jgi:hypothetical protein
VDKKTISAVMKAMGAKGGKIGGKRSLETMTAEERSERARKAVAAREANRKAVGPRKHPKKAQAGAGTNQARTH